MCVTTAAAVFVLKVNSLDSGGDMKSWEKHSAHIACSWLVGAGLFSRHSELQSAVLENTEIYW